MGNKNKGQIKVGKSGTIAIDMNSSQEYSARIKVGRSGPKVIGNSSHGPTPNDSSNEKHEYKIIDKQKGPEEERLKTIKEEKERLKKEQRHEKERLKRKKERSGKYGDKDNVEESSIIIKFSKKVDEFNALVGDNKTSGRSWYHGLEGNWWWGMTEDEARIKIRGEEDILENIEKIEDIQDIGQIDNIDGIGEIPAQESQIRTVSDMIDQMMTDYDSDLPKDSKKRISYIYPLESTHSFHIVAANHIKYLKDEYSKNNKYIEIEEIDWSGISNIDWQEKRNVLIHPFMYPFASKESFIENSRSFAKLLAMKNKIGGFDVADSDKISKPAVDLINKIDLMMVPSNFARDAYVESGVTIPIEVLPHGISDEFLDNDIVDTDNRKILKLRKMKEKGKILVLFFFIHSGHRKGADLVRKVMKRIQKKFKDVYLVVRSEGYSYFSDINSIHLDSWLNDRDLVALYDTCDICLSPSRGGGFELNALEAASRGTPTLVPNGGCFLDLINYFIPVDISDKITQPLPGNPIHIGFGHEVDMDDFETKLVDTINRLEYWKNKFRGNTKEIREKYSWRNTAKMLDEHLRNHGFIE